MNFGVFGPLGGQKIDFQKIDLLALRGDLETLLAFLGPLLALLGARLGPPRRPWEAPGPKTTYSGTPKTGPGKVILSFFWK